MKIAIVRGLAGAMQQHRRWSLETEALEVERSIANTEQNLQARRTRLAGLRKQIEAIPNREKV